MTLMAQAKMTEDNGLILRVAAAAATYGIEDPRPWATRSMWALSAQPGWAAVYDAAMKDDETVDPATWYGIHGSNPNVITDQMIIDGVAAVMALKAAQTENQTPESTETPTP